MDIQGIKHFLDAHGNDDDAGWHEPGTFSGPQAMCGWGHAIYPKLVGREIEWLSRVLSLARGITGIGTQAVLNGQCWQDGGVLGPSLPAAHPCMAGWVTQGHLTRIMMLPTTSNPTTAGDPFSASSAGAMVLYGTRGQRAGWGRKRDPPTPSLPHIPTARGCFLQRMCPASCRPGGQRGGHQGEGAVSVSPRLSPWQLPTTAALDSAPHLSSKLPQPTPPTVPL